MKLIRVYESEKPIDDVPDETEWHAPGSHNEFTACGLACVYGGTDRESEHKQGTFRDVTCSICRRTVEFYRSLR